MPERNRRALQVSVTAEDMSSSAAASVESVRGAAEAAGAANLRVRVDESDKALRVTFEVATDSHEVARGIGDDVLSAIAPDSFAWNVGVTERFVR
jgi:hypothetical protein